MRLKAKDFYALICDDSKYSKGQKAEKMLCGIYASKKEAQNAAKEIKDCLCKHYIKKGNVTFSTLQ